MKITLATADFFETIRGIVDSTIKTVYPRYYPEDVVAFFLQYHSDVSIRDDIASGNVYLVTANQADDKILETADVVVGTGSIRGDEIYRMFVLPQYQGRGFGSALLRTLEGRVAESYDRVKLDSSLPAYSMYLKAGYVPVAWQKVETGTGRVLCFNAMEKTLSFVDYNGRSFRTLTNSDNGEVTDETVFRYHQQGRMVWADYEGGPVLRGTLIGSVADDGSMDFGYQHLNREMELRTGLCHSTPEPIFGPGGKLRIREEWRWTNGDGSSGESIIEEL